MAPKIRCERCGEELDATIYAYLGHLRKHDSKKHKSLLRELHKVKTLLQVTLWSLTFVFILLLIAVLGRELQKNEPIVTPFDVPSDLKEFTGVTIAELIIDRINNKISSAPIPSSPEVVGAGNTGVGVQPARPEPVRFKRASPGGLTIKMELGGISLDSLVSYIRDILGKETEEISGNVIKSGDSIKIIARTNKKGPWSEEGGELESVVDKLAEKMAFDLASNYMESIELARFYSNNSKYEEADVIYKEIMRENSEEKPKNLKETYIEWGKVLSKLKERVEAEDKYRRAGEIDPKDSNVLVEWAIALSNMGEMEAAIEKYKKAAEIDPDNPRIYAEWGYTLFLLGDDRGSVRLFDEFVKKWGEPKNADFYNNWGIVLDGMKDYNRAIEKFKKATEIDPEKHHWAYYNWGLDLYNLAQLDMAEYERTGDRTKFDEAKKKYHESISKNRQALRISPKYVNAYNNLGINHNALGKHTEAIGQFKKATELDPKYYLGYYNWGWSLDKLGKYDEAIEKYKEAINLNPTYVNAYSSLGLSLIALEKYEEAIGQFKKATELDPKYYLGYYNWGWSLNKLGKYDEAIEKYKEAMKLNTTYIDAYNSLGLSLNNLGRYEEAMEQLKKAVEINPEYHFAYYNWGYALSALGAREEAAEKFKRFLELSNGRNPYLEQLAGEFLRSKTLGVDKTPPRQKVNIEGKEANSIP